MQEAPAYEWAGTKDGGCGRPVGEHGEGGIRDELIPPRKWEDQVETSPAAGVGQLDRPRREHFDQRVVPDDEHRNAAPGGCRIFPHLPLQLSLPLPKQLPRQSPLTRRAESYIPAWPTVQPVGTKARPRH